jgi:hypothetical protein
MPLDAFGAGALRRDCRYSKKQTRMSLRSSGSLAEQRKR